MNEIVLFSKNTLEGLNGNLMSKTLMKAHNLRHKAVDATYMKQTFTHHNWIDYLFKLFKK